jgi:hypothetical protein
MTLFDLRQTVESLIPWWLPFAASAGILAAAVLAKALAKRSTRKRYSRWR